MKGPTSSKKPFSMSPKQSVEDAEVISQLLGMGRDRLSGMQHVFSFNMPEVGIGRIMFLLDI